METVQTALTGVDVYYWFVSGFGNVERLRNSHFTPVDIPIMTAVSSLLVQAFFCYRIRVLDKRLVWLCGIIAVVCILPSCPRISQARDIFLNVGFGYSSSRSDVAGHFSQ